MMDGPWYVTRVVCYGNLWRHKENDRENHEEAGGSQMNAVVFNYTVRIEDLDELWKRGNIFHETLRGNPDYIENRIMLEIDEENRQLNVTQFEDSDTDIWVDHLGANHVPVLRIARKDV